MKKQRSCHGDFSLETQRYVWRFHNEIFLQKTWEMMVQRKNFKKKSSHLESQPFGWPTWIGRAMHFHAFPEQLCMAHATLPLIIMNTIQSKLLYHVKTKTIQQFEEYMRWHKKTRAQREKRRKKRMGCRGYTQAPMTTS